MPNKKWPGCIMRIYLEARVFVSGKPCRDWMWCAVPSERRAVSVAIAIAPSGNAQKPPQRTEELQCDKTILIEVLYSHLDHFELLYSHLHHFELLFSHVEHTCLGLPYSHCGSLSFITGQRYALGWCFLFNEIQTSVKQISIFLVILPNKDISIKIIYPNQIYIFLKIQFKYLGWKSKYQSEKNIL
jgi:hypothetical protein